MQKKGTSRWQRFSIRALLLLTLFVAVGVRDIQRQLAFERAIARMEEIPECTLFRGEPTFFGRWRGRLAGLFGVTISGAPIDYLELTGVVGQGIRPLSDDERHLFRNLPPTSKLCLDGFELSLADLRGVLSPQATRSVSFAHCVFNTGTLGDLHLPRLECLNLVRTDVPGTDNIGQLFPKLRGLYFSDIEPMPTLVETLRGCEHLQDLALSGPNVTDEILEGVATLSKLQTLSVSQAPITDRPLRHLSSLIDLKELALEDTKITNRTLIQASRLRDLQTLVVYKNNSITDEGLAPYKGNLKLTHVKIEDCPGITDRSAEVVGSWKNVRTLQLSGNSAGRRSVQQIARLKELEYLQIGTTNFHLDDLMPLADNAKISIVYCSTAHNGVFEVSSMSTNQLRAVLGRDGPTDDHISLEWLSGLDRRHLQAIRQTTTSFGLAGSQINAEIIEELSTRSEIRILDLSHTMVDVAMLEPLVKLKKLEALLLRDCPNLDGSVQEFIKRLPTTCSVEL